MPEPRTNIIESTPPNLIGHRTVEFDKSEFEAAIWQKGYDIIAETAIRCPCETYNAHNRPGCTNCQGNGYFFINALETKAIITGINRDTKYKEWSPELVGTVQITTRDDFKDKLGFYDRITFKDKYSKYSQIAELRTNTAPDEDDFIFTTYSIKSIEAVFVFDENENPLIKLPESDYNIKSNNKYIVEIRRDHFPANFNGSVSITYTHIIQYNIIDIPHEVRQSQIINRDGKQIPIDLPVMAVARRSHIPMLDAPNYDGAGIQDNSYQQ